MMSEIALKDTLSGHRIEGPLIPTTELAVAERISVEPVEEKNKLQGNDGGKGSFGIHGYLRLFQISRVIAMLSMYLYLDQLDLHIKHQNKKKSERLSRAYEMTRAAVYGEKLWGIKLWFFQSFLYTLRRIFLGTETNREKIQEKQAVWLKEKLITLGPTFIKIGQSMGTRADLLPLPFVKELGTLVDQVPAFPNDVAFSIIEHELGKKINEVYSEFELEPVAAASLGQVYRARLLSGEEVAVKVQRPNLEATIKGDIIILKKVANFAERFPHLSENADWAGMLREFDSTIHEEMDYVAEGRNAERFRESFRNWTNIHVPTIYWHASTRKVLTMEFIHGTKVTDLEEQARLNISPAKVNRLLIKTYLKQLLEDGFFHADPHPGNLLVMPDGRLAFFDFGMVGRITPQLQAKLIDAFSTLLTKTRLASLRT